MRLLLRGLVAAASVLPVAVIDATGPVHAAPPTFPAPINHLRLFAQTNGGGDAEQVYTRAQAVALAQRFDTIVGLRWTFVDHLPAMRAANPRLRYLVYMNGAMSKPNDRAGMPESWFLHDRAGKRVRNLHFDLHYMDTASTGWRDWVGRRCAEWIRLSGGADGCFLDDMGVGNLGSNLSAWPIDPRTRLPMTEQNWISYADYLQRRVQQLNPNHMITSNGINNGATYYRHMGSWRMLNSAIASAAEGWLRTATSSATTFRDVATWRKEVDMLVDAGRKGRSVLLGTKLWVRGVSAASQNQWRLYTYASFLLGTNGSQFLNFNIRGAGKPDVNHPYAMFNIGTPTEAYAARGGVYQRRYSRGLAIVNPGTTSITVNFGARYRMPTGEFRTSYVMAPHTGLVLRTA